MESSGYLDDVILKVMGALDAVDSHAASFSASGSFSDFATNSTGTSGRIASTNAMLLLREMAANGLPDSSSAGELHNKSPALPVTAAASTQETLHEGSAAPSNAAQEPDAPTVLSTYACSSVSRVADQGSSYSARSDVTDSPAGTARRRVSGTSRAGHPASHGPGSVLHDLPAVSAAPATLSSQRGSRSKGRSRKSGDSRAAMSSTPAGSSCWENTEHIPVSTTAAIQRYQVELAASKRQRAAVVRKLKSKHAAEVEELLAAQREVDAGNAAQMAAAERQYMRNISSLKRQLKEKAAGNKQLQRALQHNVQLLAQQAASDTSAKHIEKLTRHVENLASARDALQQRLAATTDELQVCQSELSVARRGAAAAIQTAEEATGENAALRRRAVQAEVALATLRQDLRQRRKSGAPKVAADSKPRKAAVPRFRR